MIRLTRKRIKTGVSICWVKRWDNWIKCAVGARPSECGCCGMNQIRKTKRKASEWRRWITFLTVGYGAAPSSVHALSDIGADQLEAVFALVQSLRSVLDPRCDHHTVARSFRQRFAPSCTSYIQLPLTAASVVEIWNRWWITRALLCMRRIMLASNTGSLSPMSRAVFLFLFFFYLSLKVQILGLK